MSWPVALVAILAEKGIDPQVLLWHGRTVRLLSVPLDDLDLCHKQQGREDITNILTLDHETQFSICLGGQSNWCTLALKIRRKKQNNVVNSASAPTNRTLAGADKQNPCNKLTSVALDKQSKIRIGTFQRAVSS